jgi:signal transduction histidine kinase
VLDCEEVLSKLRDLLARMIREDIHIEVHVAPDLWKLKADRNQLEQAIINLAINARDSMPSGGQLTIGARNVVLGTDYILRHMGATEGPHVCLSVRDTGSGMDEQTKGRIFEPFFTTKPLGAGTGLGLAMVYGFVKQVEILQVLPDCKVLFTSGAGYLEPLENSRWKGFNFEVLRKPVPAPELLAKISRILSGQR